MGWEDLLFPNCSNRTPEEIYSSSGAPCVNCHPSPRTESSTCSAQAFWPAELHRPLIALSQNPQNFSTWRNQNHLRAWRSEQNQRQTLPFSFGDVEIHARVNPYEENSDLGALRYFLAANTRIEASLFADSGRIFLGQDPLLRISPVHLLGNLQFYFSPQTGFRSNSTNFNAADDYLLHSMHRLASLIPATRETPYLSELVEKLGNNQVPTALEIDRLWTDLQTLRVRSGQGNGQLQNSATFFDRFEQVENQLQPYIEEGSIDLRFRPYTLNLPFLSLQFYTLPSNFFSAQLRYAQGHFENPTLHWNTDLSQMTIPGWLDLGRSHAEIVASLFPLQIHVPHFYSHLEPGPLGQTQASQMPPIEILGGTISAGEGITANGIPFESGIHFQEITRGNYSLRANLQLENIQFRVGEQTFQVSSHLLLNLPLERDVSGSLVPNFTAAFFQLDPLQLELETGPGEFESWMNGSQISVQASRDEDHKLHFRLKLSAPQLHLPELPSYHALNLQADIPVAGVAESITERIFSLDDRDLLENSPPEDTAFSSVGLHIQLQAHEPLHEVNADLRLESKAQGSCSRSYQLNFSAPQWDGFLQNTYIHLRGLELHFEANHQIAANSQHQFEIGRLDLHTDSRNSSQDPRTKIPQGIIDVHLQHNPRLQVSYSEANSQITYRNLNLSLQAREFPFPYPHPTVRSFDFHGNLQGSGRLNLGSGLLQRHSSNRSLLPGEALQNYFPLCLNGEVLLRGERALLLPDPLLQSATFCAGINHVDFSQQNLLGDFLFQGNISRKWVYTFLGLNLVSDGELFHYFHHLGFTPEARRENFQDFLNRVHQFESSSGVQP
ncbi:MAG: hypothetical protein HQM15_11465 [Deltaproteobacteria bacterium]|nr:hypothetical protein [Deltaproteobacteria bacterium]